MQNKHVELKKYLTMHIGGIAENFYVPVSEEELCALAVSLKDEDVRILSGGSNILANDTISYKHVIYMKKACLDKKSSGGGYSILAPQIGYKM